MKKFEICFSRSSSTTAVSNFKIMCNCIHELLNVFEKIQLNVYILSGLPREIKGPRARVKVGPQGQAGFHSESQLHPSCKLKTKKKKKRPLHADNDNSYPLSTISPYL